MKHDENLLAMLRHAFTASGAINSDMFLTILRHEGFPVRDVKALRSIVQEASAREVALCRNRLYPRCVPVAPGER